MSALTASLLVYQFAFKMPAPEPDKFFYEGILNGTNALSKKEFDSVVKKRFFALVDQAPLFIIWKMLARVIYPFFLAEVSYIVDSVSQRVLKDIHGTIDQEMQKDKCAGLANHHLKNVGDYLKELCDIYAQLKNSSAKGKIDKALEEELKARLAKLGFPQEKLNRDFATQFLRDYPIPYSLIDVVSRFLKQFKFSKSSALHFLNPVLGVIYTFIYGVLWLLIVAPQKLMTCIFSDKVLNEILPHRLLNKSIQYGFELFISNTELLEEAMKSFRATVEHPEFSYTLNTNVEALLRDACFQIEEDVPMLDATVKLDHLEPILKRLFALLEVNSAETIEDLKDLPFNPDSPFEKEDWLTRFINDLIVNGAVDNIPACFETLVTPLEVEKLIAAGLRSINTLYDIPPTITAEQIADAKRKSPRRKRSVHQSLHPKNPEDRRPSRNRSKTWHSPKIFELCVKYELPAKRDRRPRSTSRQKTDRCGP